MQDVDAIKQIAINPQEVGARSRGHTY
jgi:hypothetical protein